MSNSMQWRTAGTVQESTLLESNQMLGYQTHVVNTHTVRAIPEHIGSEQFSLESGHLLKVKSWIVRTGGGAAV